MKAEEIFSNEEAFKKWLPLNGVIKSTYYPHHIKDIQKYLKIKVDVLLEKGIDEALKK